MTISEFFDNLENGATWSAGVSFKRSNPLPIERYSVFKSEDDAKAYAKTNPVAYPGQVIAVVTSSGATAYLIREVGAADTVTDGGLTKLAQTTGTGDVGETVAQLQSDLTALAQKVGTDDISSLFPDATAVDEQTVTNALLTLKTIIDNKINSVTAANKSITVSTDVNKTAKVNVKISTVSGNILTLKNDSGKEGLYVPTPQAQKDYTVTVDTSKTTEGAAKSYTIKQLGKDVATIDIPKDMVVSEGKVEKLTTKPNDFPSDQTFTAGVYIILTIANKSASKLYIPADGLVEYVTSGSAAGDAIVINVSTDHKVTATLSDNAVTTAKIKDKNVTKTKLADDVQTSLGLADSALQKENITTGTANGTISVLGTNISVKGLGAAAYKAVASTVTSSSTALPTAQAVAAYVTEMTAVYRYELGSEKV